MPPPTETPSKSVLQGIPPEDRQATLIEALCKELETAIQSREKAIAKADNAHENRQKEMDALIAEMDLLMHYRDDALAELSRMRAEHTKEVATLRTELETASKERDSILLRMAETEDAHQKQVRTLEERQVAKVKSPGHEELTRERDAYKVAADKLLGERMEALKERDKATAELTAGRQEVEARHANTVQTHQKEIEKLKRRLAKLEKEKHELSAASEEQISKAREALAQQVEQARDDHQKELTSLAAQRDELQAARDQMAVQLETLREEHRANLEALHRMRDEVSAQQHATAEGFKVAIEQRAQEILNLSAERDALETERTELTVQLGETRERHQKEIESLRRERDALAEARNTVATQSAELREAHSRQLDAHLLQGEHYQREIKALNAQREELLSERHRLTAQLEQFKAGHRQPAEKSAPESDEVRRGYDERIAELNRAREEDSRQLQAQTAQIARLQSEQAALCADFDQTKIAHAQDVENLKKERDDLLRARREIAAEFAKVGGQQRSDIEKLAEHQDELARERNRIAAELAHSREEHAKRLEALTRERDSLVAARDELRDALDETLRAHRREMENVRQESAAVSSERDEMQAMLERDRLSWRKQIALFTQERDTLRQERDESLVEATQQRQTQSRQIELRAQECEALAGQRDELLAQLNELREAQKRQNEVIHEERRIHARERSALAARLDQAVKSLGVDRTDLLAQKLDAQYRLESQAASHGQELEAMASEREALIGERDAARAEVEPFRTTQERERELLGTDLAHKFESLAPADEESPGGPLRLRDLAIEREVEVKYLRRPGAADADLIAEARRLGRLQHPNIPPIYDVGFDELGRPFYTTRIVTGMTLHAILGQLEHGKTRSLLHFTLKRLLGVFHKVCDGVAFAHANGIAHGALDAEHIVLGEFGEVFITGWNLRSEIAFPGEHTGDLDVQSDVMALGRMLYEIVTLEPPPEPGTVRHESPPGQRRGPERASQSHYWANDTNLNTLVGVARRALDRRAVDQFRSVKDFQMRVDAFKDTFDDPTRLTLRRLFRRWSRGHRTATFLIALIVILIGCACAYLLAEKMTGHKFRPREFFWRSHSSAP